MPPELMQQIQLIHDDCEQAIEEQQWDAALAGFERMLPLLKSTEDWVGVARVHLRMGQLSEELSQNERAAAHYAEVRRIAETTNDRPLLAAALHRLAHFERLAAPERARALFQECLDLQINDPEADALSLAMIGQIDYTAGDQLPGLELMLQALQKLPDTSNSRSHLLEHVVYFGRKIPIQDFRRLVHLHIADSQLATQLLDEL